MPPRTPPPQSMILPTLAPPDVDDSTRQNWTDPSGRTYEVVYPNPARIPFRSPGISILELPYPPTMDLSGFRYKCKSVTLFYPAGYIDDDDEGHIYWPPFDARLMLSHKDRRVLPQDVDLLQHRTGFSCRQQNPNYLSFLGPIPKECDVGPSLIAFKVPKTLKNANDGYFFRFANVSDPSITYYETATFPIFTEHITDPRDALLAALLGVGVFFMLLVGAFRLAAREQRTGSVAI
ncbi:uncharacterized protein LOC62_07G009721 [Vanrija pseudolonga]|uniref:Uncharacterized protein n=1 Tax=Vanrija pseudolonga TaxID=143232 RepID=A0AAF0YKT4_9TREE|nr:hypothetical protein LOC62_07G009721 [Vanrija pseudolonga]